MLADNGRYLKINIVDAKVKKACLERQDWSST